MPFPVVELSECIRCGICVEVCPIVFKHNAAGFIQVADLDAYPTVDVNEAIKNCPVDCIYWNDR